MNEPFWTLSDPGYLFGLYLIELCYCSVSITGHVASDTTRARTEGEHDSMRSQQAVTAYLKSKLLLPFGLAGQYDCGEGGPPAGIPVCQDIIA